MIGIVVLTVAAWAARSVALAGFGLDSLIEIGASTVVVWELSGTGEARQHRALRLMHHSPATSANEYSAPTGLETGSGQATGT